METVNQSQFDLEANQWVDWIAAQPRQTQVAVYAAAQAHLIRSGFFTRAQCELLLQVLFLGTVA